MSLSYRVSVRDRFSAAHALRGHDGGCESLHGHNWEVRAEWACAGLDAQGLGLDFLKAQAALKQALSAWEHRDLGGLPEFQTQNPSAENLARLVFERLDAQALGPARLRRVEVFETPDCGASYGREEA